MNKNMLLSKMKLYGDRNVDLAKYLKISPQSLSSRKTGKNDFTQGEILKIMIRYNLTPQEMTDIFFNE